MSREFLRHRLLPGLLILLFVSAIYLYAFPQSNLVYPAVVLLHAATGVAATILLIAYLVSLLRTSSWTARVGWILLGAGAVLGLILIKVGTARAEWNWLYLHIVLCLAGVGFVLADRAGKRWLASSPASAALRGCFCLD